MIITNIIIVGDNHRASRLLIDSAGRGVLGFLQPGRRERNLWPDFKGLSDISVFLTESLDERIIKFWVFLVLNHVSPV